jgi:hypothetical protein
VFRPAKQPEITPETSQELAETPSELVQPEVVQPEVNASQPWTAVPNISAEPKDADEFLSEFFESRLKE